MLFIILIAFTIIIGLLGIFLLIQYNRKDPGRIFGVYSQPGKWFYLKYIIFSVIFTAESLKKYYKEFKERVDIKNLEKLQPLSSHDKAFDAVFIQAVNDEGYYLSGGIERRHQARINAVFYIMVPKLGLLRSEHLPKTSQPVDPRTLLEMKDYSGAGITISPLEAMAIWKLNLDTKMILVEENKLVDVKLDAVWTSKYPYFMFDKDISSKSIAQAIANEKWNKQLFKNLKSAHQTHYEQMGFLEGTLTIDGENKYIKLYGFRDHSFGHKRDWSLMHRYIYHIVHLVNGVRLSVGVISQPCTTSHLTLGYVLTPNLHGPGKAALVAIEACDLQLYQHGENGRPSTDIAFTCRTTDGAVYEVTVHSLADDEHFKGNDIEARLIERFVTCEVNGIKGRGISEWHYNNTDRVYFGEGKSKPKFYLGCNN